MLEDLIKGLINETTKKEEVIIGKISEELQEEFKSNSKKGKQMARIIERKVKLYIAELEAEYDMDQYELKKQALWERLFDELNVPQDLRDESYSIDVANGNVSVEMEETNKGNDVFKISESDFALKKRNPGPLQ